MGDPLTIKVRHEQDYVIVTAAGEIDISTVTRMRECLFDLAASGRPLVADLDQVSFIDSTGLAALVGMAKRATCRGGGLYAVCGARRSASCSVLPSWTAGYRWPALWTRPWKPWRPPGAYPEAPPPRPVIRWPGFRTSWGGTLPPPARRRSAWSMPTRARPVDVDQ
jgi:anti-anti-sigma factor